MLSVTVLSTRMVYGKVSCRAALDRQACKPPHHVQVKLYSDRAAAVQHALAIEVSNIKGLSMCPLGDNL